MANRSNKFRHDRVGANIDSTTAINPRRPGRRETGKPGRSNLGLAVLFSMFAAALTLVAGGDAVAQQTLTPVEIWGSSGSVDANPFTWVYTKADSAATNIGTATAAAVDYNDAGWTPVDLPKQFFAPVAGPKKAFHFRKEFNLIDLGIELHQVDSISVQIQYDDTAVMYLNGVEVYRSIRGNLADFDEAPPNFDFPYDTHVSHGGYEIGDARGLVNIPDPGGTNQCQLNPGCPHSPYGSANPPAVPVSLLRSGTNVVSVTTWSNSIGGSGDTALRHQLTLNVDPNAIPANPVVINEVMAKNTDTWEVNLDADPELETPDWIELRNTSAEVVDLAGWTLSDSQEDWTFPAGSQIAANGYLVVAATGRDDTTTNPMQTNFKLSSSDERVDLVSSWGASAATVAWTDQFADNSIGLPNNSGDATYLSSPTRGQANASRLLSHPPVLRFFADRYFNPGETVDLQVRAFDPDADGLSYTIASPPAGVQIDSITGALTGTANFTDRVTSTITVIDGDGDRANQSIDWFMIDAPLDNTPPIALNEYNAVPADGELLGGSEFGNGGDWFEFVVLEDNLDLRGYTIEFRQRDGDTDNVRMQTFTTFADVAELSRVPAGTLITISEENPDDLSFDGNSDWTVNLRIANDGNGAYFEPAPPGSIFNSTRRDQTVLIKDAQGRVVTPLTGETDAWDVNAGISGGEVMNFCLSPTPGAAVDPIGDYYDNKFHSTFGQPNLCTIPDPNDPLVDIERQQDLSGLRDVASFGRHGGDVDCSGDLDSTDALLVLRYLVESEGDDGMCVLGAGGPNHRFDADAGDLNRDAAVTVADALLVLRCSAGEIEC